MASNDKIDSIYDFTDKGLRELESWMEPWLKGVLKGETGGTAVGALEWEDVGTGVGLDPWAQYALFQSTAIVSAGGGSLAFSWAPELVGHDPLNQVANRHATITHQIVLLSAGVFSVEASIHVGLSGLGVTKPLVFSLTGSSGRIGAGECVVPYSPDYQETSGSLTSFWRSPATPSTFSLYARDLTWPVGSPAIDVVLCVRKLSP